MTAALLMLMLVVRGVVAWLRQTGQLSGDLSEDRRRVLAALGGLGVAGLVGPEEAAPRPLQAWGYSHECYYEDLAGETMVVMADRVYQWFIDPARGSDAADGRSADSPLRTHRALQEKLEQLPADQRGDPVTLLWTGEQRAGWQKTIDVRERVRS